MTTYDINNERAIAIWAAAHHGVITKEVARAHQLSESQITTRIGRAQWRSAARGVYVITGSPTTWKQKLTIAWLVGGQGAAASHLSAAAMHQAGNPPPIHHVTLPVGSHQQRRLGRFHRSPLDPVDVTTVDGIDVTTPARTLVDCAMLCGPERLAKLVDNLLTRRLCTVMEVWEALDRVERSPGRRGSGRLRRALEPWCQPIEPDSVAETRLLRRIEEWGFPEPVTQHKVHDQNGIVIARLDLAWPDTKVGLEYDGREFHGPRRWQHDEDRHRDICALGWKLRHVEVVDLALGSAALHRFLSERLIRAT